MRNFDNILFASLRQKIDPIINDLHDSLEIAYYQNWKLGQSQDWFGFNALGTPAESKAQFDKLHGLIFHLYSLLFGEANAQDPEPASDAKWNPDGDKLTVARQYIIDSGFTLLQLAALKNYVISRAAAAGYTVGLN